MKSRAWAVALVLVAAFTPEALWPVQAGAAAADDSYYRGRFHGSHGYGYDTFRIGLDYGYEEGLREGRRDGERHHEYRFSNDRRFRHGDAGYRRSFGPRHEYVRGFRSGYERGYRAGYESSIRHAYRRGYGYGGPYYKTGHHGPDRYPY